MFCEAVAGEINPKETIEQQMTNARKLLSIGKLSICLSDKH